MVAVVYTIQRTPDELTMMEEEEDERSYACVQSSEAEVY